MKLHKRILSAILVFAFSVSALTSCSVKNNGSTFESTESVSSESTTAENSFTVTDQIGRTVSFDSPAEKIVSVYYISTAILIALGAEDNIAGIEMKAASRGLYKLAAPQIIQLPAVGSGKGIDIEATAALSPDVVIIPKKLSESVDALEEIGLKVIVISPETEEDFNECIPLIGKICGKDARAQELLDSYAEIKADTFKYAADSFLPSVYVSSASSYLSAAGKNMYQSSLISMAGGTNAAYELDDSYWAIVSDEQINEWNPDYWLIASEADYTVSDILSNEALSAVNAVKNGNVYEIPSDIEPWDYPTPSSVLGIVWLAKTLHGKYVSDEFFMEKAISFYSEFYGIDVNAEILGVK